MNPKYSRYYSYIKPVIQNKLVKTYGTLIFSLVTITIFSLFAIKPTVSTIVALQKSINQETQTLEKLNQKVQSLSLGKKNFDNLDTSTKSKMFSLLPNSTSLPLLIDQLTSLSLEKQASISGLQVHPVELKAASPNLSKEATLKELDFTLTAQGSYQQLTNFLDSLPKLSRLIMIKSISLNKPIDGSLIMSVNAKAYFIKD